MHGRELGGLVGKGISVSFRSRGNACVRRRVGPGGCLICLICLRFSWDLHWIVSLAVITAATIRY
jgi:hypothetical protein